MALLLTTTTVLTELVYSLYYYAIKPKQPLGGDRPMAACVLTDCVSCSRWSGRFLRIGGKPAILTEIDVMSKK